MKILVSCLGKFDVWSPCRQLGTVLLFHQLQEFCRICVRSEYISFLRWYNFCEKLLFPVFIQKLFGNTYSSIYSERCTSSLEHFRFCRNYSFTKQTENRNIAFEKKVALSVSVIAFLMLILNADSIDTFSYSGFVSARFEKHLHRLCRILHISSPLL
jgi:hypothetical protein